MIEKSLGRSISLIKDTWLPLVCLQFHLNVSRSLCLLSTDNWLQRWLILKVKAFKSLIWDFVKKFWARSRYCLLARLSVKVWKQEEPIAWIHWMRRLINLQIRIVKVLAFSGSSSNVALKFLISIKKLSAGIKRKLIRRWNRFGSAGLKVA